MAARKAYDLTLLFFFVVVVVIVVVVVLRGMSKPPVSDGRFQRARKSTPNTSVTKITQT